MRSLSLQDALVRSRCRKRREPDRTLDLAVPFDTFAFFFQERFVQEAVKLYQLKLVVYDPEKEVVVEWKD